LGLFSGFSSFSSTLVVSLVVCDFFGGFSAVQCLQYFFFRWIRRSSVDVVSAFSAFELSLPASVVVQHHQKQPIRSPKFTAQH
jgi:hypothetical protein